jgi:hypothetical protein
MLNKQQKHAIAIWAPALLLLASLSCQVTGSPAPAESTPIVQVLSITQIVPVTQVVTPTQIPLALNAPLGPEIILQRLNVSFLGQDGKKVIGSGCPGTDGKGSIVDYHFMVGGVDENRQVQRVLVAGDNSTLTWASPCNNTWALEAANQGNGVWEIFIAPSLPSKTYTILFFYSDKTIALGMVSVE